MFLFVAQHDIGLHLDRPAHRLYAQRHIASGHRGGVHLEPVKEGRIPQQPVFDDLAISGEEITRLQCAKHGRIGQYKGRLMKRADKVLAL